MRNVKFPGRFRFIAVAGLALLMASLPSVGNAIEPLDGADSGTLIREPLLRPDELGDGKIDGLQFPDPTEGLALISPPVASNTGDAED